VIVHNCRSIRHQDSTSFDLRFASRKLINIGIWREQATARRRTEATPVASVQVAELVYMCGRRLIN
jgi:hypothetical protein